ncbi:MAG TPA: His/Gly/Thr/Pro-type tRNA ligase C-terminal domain-containing protein [Candidatus Paceibacterota bacterium]|nr:His/Gly/Thr/Pro-type tRNA ligase C-terminal domain-containing protein [Candidatus Paceibacterota bacterium]
MTNSPGVAVSSYIATSPLVGQIAFSHSDDQALINYSKSVVAELRANMVRVDEDFSATPFKAKISNAEQLRVHTMLVIGGRDMEAGAVMSVHLHHRGPQGAKPKAEVVADILSAIKERRAQAACGSSVCANLALCWGIG